MEGQEAYFDIEAIQGAQDTPNGRMYWIKYKDFSIDHNEWQTVEGMEGADALMEEFDASFHQYVRGSILEYAIDSKNCKLARAMLEVMGEEEIKNHANKT